MFWEMAGTSKDDVKVALLECGANNPFGDMDMFPYPDGTDIENYVLVHQCMKSSGFKYSPADFCQEDSMQTECHSDGTRTIPVRDARVRLNSAFCKHPDYSKWKICQPFE